MWPFEDITNIVQMLAMPLCMAAVLYGTRKTTSKLAGRIMSAGLLCNFMGSLFWTVHILILGYSPESFSASDIAWIAGFLFLAECCRIVVDASHRRGPWWVWVMPLAVLANIADIICRYGQPVQNVIWGLFMMVLAFFASRGLAVCLEPGAGVAVRRWIPFLVTSLAYLLADNILFQSWGILYTIFDIVVTCTVIASVITFMIAAKAQISEVPSGDVGR